MRLPLPTGTLQPVPPAIPILPVATPVHAGNQSSDTVVSKLLTDSALSPLVAEVLSTHVGDQIRDRRRASYNTSGVIERRPNALHRCRVGLRRVSAQT